MVTHAGFLKLSGLHHIGDGVDFIAHRLVRDTEIVTAISGVALIDAGIHGSQSGGEPGALGAALLTLADCFVDDMDDRHAEKALLKELVDKIVRSVACHHQPVSAPFLECLQAVENVRFRIRSLAEKEGCAVRGYSVGIYNHTRVFLVHVGRRFDSQKSLELSCCCRTHPAKYAQCQAIVLHIGKIIKYNLAKIHKTSLITKPKNYYICSHMKQVVIIPTYNEKENIEKIIRAVRSQKVDFHILVIDDGSPDGTAAIVKRLQAEFPQQLFLIERSGKLGLGTAYLTGFRWALEHDYDFIFEMDADFSHNPDDLPRLYEACHDRGAGLAIGSRYCNGISVINWPIGRVIMSYFASKYVRTVLRMKVYDCTAGFKCYTRELLSKIDFDRVKMHGYGFQIEMKYNACKLGFKIEEVPIIFIDRKEGTSKMSSGIFGEAFWGVLALRFRKIRAKR